MTKIVLNTVANPDRLATINENFDKIEATLNDEVLYRDNPAGQPNAMSNNLDMNGYRVYNLGAPLLPSEAVRLQDLQDVLVTSTYVTGLGEIQVNNTNPLAPVIWTDYNFLTIGGHGFDGLITINAGVQSHFRVELSYTAVTLGNPTNLMPGRRYVFKLVQPELGGVDIAFGNKFIWASGEAPKIDIAPNAVTFIEAIYDQEMDQLHAQVIFGESGGSLDPVVLTDAATIATDASLGNTFTVTLTDNRTMGAPTNLVNGAVYNWHITQDGVGGRTLGWNAIFKFAGGTAPTLTTTAGKTDMIAGQYLSGPNVIRMGTLLKGYD